LTAIEAPASGAMLTILRNVPLTQATDYVSNDEFPAETHEQNLDKLTMITQQLQEQLDRAILLEKSTTESPITAGSLSEALEALGAQAVAEGLYATSATSLAIGTGSKVFTVEEGKAFRAGDYVLVTSDANPTVNGMGGQVDSYSDTTLTITVPSGGTLGSGTYADWTIRISGPAGPQGASGAGTGDMLRSNNLSDVISAATSFSNIKQAATNAATGVVELATNTELLTGSDTGRAVTPDNIAALWEKAADVASAGTVSLGEGGFFHITGTTTITDIDFATAVDGRKAALIFDGILTLTHSSTLKLPGNANITTAAGDRAMIVQDSGDTMIMLWYQRAASGASNIGNMARRTITSADTVAGSDKGQVIEITSGTFSLAFTAAATLGTGFWSIITNTGNGNVTLDPNGSETIDGATSWVLYPGGSVLVVGDGSVFHSVLLAPMMVTFTSTGSFVVPGCGGHVLVELWGGGAGGARGASGNTANGGGGGGYGRYVYKMSTGAAILSRTAPPSTTTQTAMQAAAVAPRSWPPAGKWVAAPCGVAAAAVPPAKSAACRSWAATVALPRARRQLAPSPAAAAVVRPRAVSTGLPALTAKSASRCTNGKICTDRRQHRQGRQRPAVGWRHAAGFPRQDPADRLRRVARRQLGRHKIRQKAGTSACRRKTG
jgi:hypothetical protein